MLFLLACISLPGAQAAPTLTIEGTTSPTPSAEASWSTGPLVAQRGLAVSVRIVEQEGADIRWYQVFPDLDIWYQNANRAWESKPYQWSGFHEIEYERVELREWRDSWQVEVFDAAGNSALLGDP